MRDVEGSLPGFLRRLQPSENDINNGWKDTVNLEDRLRLKQWRKEGAPGLAAAAKPLPPPPSREVMLDFAASKDGAAWRAALADPEAAAAMRQVRARVGHLLEQGRAVLEFRPVPPEAGSQLLNAREKGPNAFATSTFHPLAYDPLEVGWDPRAKRWTGRRGLCGLKKEETSFWCSG